MKKKKWSFYATAGVALCLAAALMLPILRGESPIDFGLDLSGGVVVTYRPDFTSRLDSYEDLTHKELLALAKETLISRLYRNLSTIPDVVVTSDERIVVSIPGNNDQRRILQLIGETYHLTLRLVLGFHDRPVEGQELFPYRGQYLELAQAEFTGEMLDERYIRVETPQGGHLDVSALTPKVAFRFRAPHDDAFGRFTGDNVGRRLAILLDDRVEWAGVIESAITDSGVLAGSYSLEEANEIAMILKSGTLPMSLKVESLSAVGAALGQEIQDLGLRALLLSVGLLSAVIAIAYLHRGALLVTGLVSLFCLLFLIAGTAAAFGLTLDMVGIAGIVLSVGMGMDAFIIVFESLEGRSSSKKPGVSKLRCDRLAKQAYSFKREGRTLFHANATTVVVIALLLATERLRSFALFIFAGLFASVLTIYVTKNLLRATYGRVGDFGPDLLAWLRRFRPRIFRFRKPYFVAVALALVTTGTALWSGGRFSDLAGASLSFGADFQEGTQVIVASRDAGNVDRALRRLRESYPEVPVRHQSLGEPDQGRYLLTLGTAVETRLAATSLPEDGAATLSADTLEGLLAAESVEMKKLSSIDSRVSSSRLMKSLSVFLLSFFCLALYFVVFQERINRFFAAWVPTSRAPSTRLLIFAGVLLAVVVDVTLVLAALAFMKIPVSLPVIAALLTVIGYSVNDSVVLWSHVENLRSRSHVEEEMTPATTSSSQDPPWELSPEGCVTESVDRILSRALLTSVSTLVPAVTILAVGLTPLRDFAWVMIVGTVAGTLSSMFIVGSFAVRALEQSSRPARVTAGERPAYKSA